MVDHSFLTISQKPLEPISFVVFVFVDDESRVCFLPGFDLALKVVCLRHSAVVCVLGRLFLGRELVVLEVLSSVGGVEPALSTRCELEVDVAADSKGFGDNPGTSHPLQGV